MDMRVEIMISSKIWTVKDIFWGGVCKVMRKGLFTYDVTFKNWMKLGIIANILMNFTFFLLFFSKTYILNNP